MKYITLGAMTFSILIACNPLKKSENSNNFVQYVNPMIGTDFTGNTYPGAQAPFGMVQLSPDNGLPGWDRISGYFYPDSTIAGFSHTHLSGTGAGDLYDISFMPVTKPYKEAPAPLGIYSSFSHEDEKASAGYYRVFLKDYGINVELTATERCGIQRYTFPEAEAVVFLNLKKAMNWDFTLDSYVEVIDSVTIRGYRFSRGWSPDQRVYFETRFSKPFVDYSLDTTSIVENGKHIGTAYIARFDFDTKDREQIVVFTGISGVSIEGASKNLNVEAPKNDFDLYHDQVVTDWNKQLSVIEVKGGSVDDRTKFYTALYHTMIAPTIYSDVDGSYFGPDKQIHKTDGWVNYSTFSLWDTYRASHPLFTYTEPEKTNDMVKSFLAFYDQYGSLPLWNLYGNETDMMIGYHAVPVIVDAYLKGIGDFDSEKALQACIASSDRNDYRGIGLYKKYGYIPYNLESESLSKTLEYAYDDYCIAKMAEKMGKKEIADRYYKRSQSYRNLYNPATSFIQPKDDKGKFIPEFDAKDYSAHITESNGWQYFWYVPQDIDGLIGLLGSKDRFAQKLDSMFTYAPDAKDDLPIFSTGMIGQYAHGNEPSHHVIYLYNKIGQPWKTQKYVAEVLHQLYLNTPAGLCGNEDCGQMSAWFVFSAMGFYPVDPVSGQYEIGTPLFPEIKMRVANGKVFTVLAPKVDAKNIYIQSVKLNGKPYDKSYITHEQIMHGDTIEFEMGDHPGPVWYKS
ncbi:GH92 family glycosyl hydrolase [Coprobacter tertius]|uniref:GH92 family glycosyl hydrolase n=1 Tax=Coprobacter tertius TaxID=2944915 RepID=A0ABT1MKS1_9BACT|nr:GH92 family glycosyl hydrolase [Coprobacter tertius]MCP9611856.1 GH92 family glycosyl hydrolase [Coprobacter tertius]